jgi:Tol biopolymer transport system component
MNRGPTERVISEWLADEAPFELDELVLDATFARTRRTRQTGRAPIRRLFTMNRSFALATGAVAIAIAVIGAALLLRTPGPAVSSQPSNLPAGSPAAVAPSLAATAGSPSPIAVTPRPITGPTFSLALVNRDGSVRQDLHLPSDAWMAALSGDGTQVAFLTSSREFRACPTCITGGQHLAIVGVGNSSATALDPGNEPETDEPAWSPDGTGLAYMYNGDIYVLTTRMEGTVIRTTTTRLTTDFAGDEFPAWTPDGKNILFDRLGSAPVDGGGFSDTQEIWSVPASGGTPTQLTHNDVADAFPDVAADGTIVFWRRGEIWTMDPAGGHQRLVYRSTDLYNPRWSPDGKTIALLRYDPSQRVQTDESLGMVIDQPKMNVVLLDVATKKLTDVGPSVASDLNPVAWTPDGESLLIDRVMGLP